MALTTVMKMMSGVHKVQYWILMFPQVSSVHNVCQDWTLIYTPGTTQQHADKIKQISYLSYFWVAMHRCPRWGESWHDGLRTCEKLSPIYVNFFLATVCSAVSSKTHPACLHWMMCMNCVCIIKLYISSHIINTEHTVELFVEYKQNEKQYIIKLYIYI